jgi:hypothetical protein
MAVGRRDGRAGQDVLRRTGERIAAPACLSPHWACSPQGAARR